MTPQFFSVVRPDGVEISCGDLVTIAPTCTDLAFIIIEIYQEDLREMMKAQKCELSDGMVAKFDKQFSLTCPVTSVHRTDSKISSQFTKTVQDIRRKAILRCAERRKSGVSASSQKTRVGCQTTRGDQESHDNEGSSQLYFQDWTSKPGHRPRAAVVYT